MAAVARSRADPGRRDRAPPHGSGRVRGVGRGRRRLSVTAADVLEVLDALEPLEARLDGGWGVDALLGEQTREHEDVDVVIGRRHAYDARARLAALGFAHDAAATPGLPARLVLGDARGRRVDFHLIVRDTAGNGWQQLDDGTWGRYDGDGLDAWGTIAGRRVPCISAELQLRHHRGYEWTENDRRDMTRLAERFGLEL